MSSTGPENNESTASPSYGKCANPDCEENGKLKCASCSSVAYCSHQCQKKHWPAHKANCKSQKVANVPAPQPQAQPQKVEPNAQLQALKNDIQRHFSMGDFENAIRKSEEALTLAKTLPPLVALAETIQLHINLSTAFVHMNRPVDGEAHATLAVKSAESGVTQRPNQPQPLEVLSIAMGCKSVALLANAKIDEALELAQRSLSIGESIYPKNDPRLHKALRTLALIQDKKGNHNDAEMTLVRAYTIICIAGGPQAGEAQLITEDIVGIFTRKGDFEGAEKYARKNYKAIKEKTTLTGMEPAILADSATRLANTLVRKGDHASAEEYVMEALEIRNRPEFANLNPVGMAYSLSQLAAIREQLGKADQEVESMLRKALEIFTRTKGPNSQETMNTLAQLKNYRAKKHNSANNDPDSPRKQISSSSSGVVVDDASDDEGGDSRTNNQNRTVSSSSGGGRQVASSSSGGKKIGGGLQLHEASQDISPEDQRNIDSLQPNNGIVRMQLAQHFFEQQKFAAAELVLQQATTIFLQQNGPEHEHTKAARQNLHLVRNNRLNQLWMQVVTEEVLKLEELKISGKCLCQIIT
jgi:tetratricopeptide (TPR) repeat protein